MSTIAAISTAPGIGGIGIVRMSGKECFDILDKFFKPISDKPIKGYSIKYGKIYDNDEVVDEVLVSYFIGPKSYTTENMCEINSHGGMIVMKKILDVCLKNGADLAEPGEFTKRAFLNGRIDLTQAEAVIDVINSKTEKEAKASMNQLEGYLSKKIKEIREDLISGMADIEVSIDYPEYDVEEVTNTKILEILDRNAKRLNELEKSFSSGKILREGVKTAIIGRPNAGKSSLINKLLGEDRLIVSDIAGTTRDAIDTTVKRNGKEYVFIDTAGLRKKARVKEDIERYSVIRTVAAVERCDVAILVIDAEEGITEQDAKIAGIAHERGKGMIIAVNKWDLIEKNDKTIYKFTNQVREVLSYMSYAELVFISAKTGQRLPKIFDVLDMVIENHALRVQTGVLNEILTEAVAMKQPPSDKGKRLKLYYITQVSVKPPTFVVFINDRQLMHFSYTRYLENQIRNTFGFRGTPIHIIARERKER